MRFAFFLIMLSFGFLPSLSFAQVQKDQGYYGGNTGLYNQNAVPVPLNQLIAGQNAPSYNYNGAQAAYNAQTNTQTYQPQGTLTQAQEASLEAQYLQQEAAYQTQLLQQSAQANQQPQYGQVVQGGLVGGLQNPNSLQAQLAALNGVGQTGQPQNQNGANTKVRRVVRNALNNPLSTPPRLFNPDQ